MKVNLTPWSPKRAIFQNAAFFGKTLVVACLAVLSSFSMNAQNGCGCNDNVILGLENVPNGRPTAITVDMILEDPARCNAGWIRLRQNGMWVGIDPADNSDIEPTDSDPRFGELWVDCSYKNTTIYAEVLRPLTGGGYEVVCWGTVNVEDKKAPDCFIRNVTLSCDVEPTPANVNDAYGQAATNENSTYGWPRNIDNCGPMNMVKEWRDEDNRNACGVGYINRTWTVTDMSGNSVTCTQRIDVLDQTPPSISWPADVTLTCDVAAATGTDSDVTGEPDYSDNCAQLGVSQTEQTSVICENACYKIFRTWKITDWCKYDAETGSGVYEHTQLIKVVDDSIPTFELPDTLKLGISTIRGWNPNNGCVINNFEAPEPGNLDDNCGDVSFSVVMYVDNNGNCEVDAGDDVLPTDANGRYDDLTCSAYIAVYSIRDCCGNSVTKKVCVVIYDDVPPVAICDDSSNLSIGYAQNPRAGRNECSFTTFTNGFAEICVDAIDDGSYDNCTDDIDLGIAKGGAFDPNNHSNPPTSGYRDCLSFRCSEKGEQVVWLRAQDDACPSTCDERDAGYCWMIVNVEDKNPALCTFTPRNVTVECGDDISEATLGSAEFRDECELDSCWVIDESDLYCGGDITRTWYVRDCGGNITSCSQTITVVLPDWDLVCPAAEVEIDCDGFENSNPDSTVTGVPKVTLSDTCNRVAILGPFDSRGPVIDTDNDKIIRTWEIIDWCTGDVTICEQKIILIGCRGMRSVGNVGGFVQSVSAQPVQGAQITVNGTTTNATNQNGEYNFPNMFLNESYDVEATMDGNDTEGLNTLDIIVTRQHILNSRSFNSPFQYIAADVNGDESINTLDIIYMRQVILGQMGEFNINAWNMIPSSANLADNPFSSEIPSVYTMTLTADATDMNFTAVKVGDVDGSFDVTARTSGTVSVSTSDLVVTAGETVVVPFNFASDLLGYQMTINTKGLEFVAHSGADANFNVTSNGIATSWDAFSTSDKNFTVTFKATDNVRLSDVISLTSGMVSTEAYDRDGNVNDLELTFNTNNVEFVLNQNVPNPFAAATTISYTLPEAMEAVLTVVDLSGRVIYTDKQNGVKGSNHFELSNLTATGVLYYTLKAGEFTATNKMINNK